MVLHSDKLCWKLEFEIEVQRVCYSNTFDGTNRLRSTIRIIFYFTWRSHTIFVHHAPDSFNWSAKFSFQTANFCNILAHLQTIAYEEPFWVSRLARDKLEKEKNTHDLPADIIERISQVHIVCVISSNLCISCAIYANKCDCNQFVNSCLIRQQYLRGFISVETRIQISI